MRVVVSIVRFSLPTSLLRFFVCVYRSSNCPTPGGGERPVEPLNYPDGAPAGTPQRRPGDYQFYAHGLDERPNRTMLRKLKKLNGSPGRARTADLVINSRRLTLFMGQ